MKLSDLKSFSTADLNKKLDQKYGFKIKTAGLSESKARDLLAKVQENIVAYKRKFGHVLSEKNGQFMQLLVMKEGLQRWLVENNHVIINEGEMQQAETILAAKDIVDRLQKMVEDISSIVNEDIPPLLDSMRDQLGSDKAAAYNGSVNNTLSSLLDTLKQARESVNTATMSLSGEAAAPMAAPGAEMPAVPGAEVPGADLGAGDAMGATDAAAGGEAELGREAR